jgi:hypothetical protein
VHVVGGGVPEDMALRSPLLDARVLDNRDEADRAAQRRRRRHHHTTHPAATTTNPPPPAAGATPNEEESGEEEEETPGTSGGANAGGAPSSSAGHAEAPPSGGAPSGGGHGGGGATSAPAGGETSGGQAASSGGGGGSSGGTEEEPDIELIRHREHQARTHRVLGFTTLGSLVVTEVLGTLLAINEGTLFSQPCGCITFAPLIPLHLTSAFVTVSLYATTGVFALTMPDPEHAAVGTDTRAEHLRWHKRLAWVHFVGMTLMPILGAATTMPSLFGVSGAGLGEFRSAMLTTHLLVGYLTLAALTTAMVFEL